MGSEGRNWENKSSQEVHLESSRLRPKSEFELDVCLLSFLRPGIPSASLELAGAGLGGGCDPECGMSGGG